MSHRRLLSLASLFSFVASLGFAAVSVATEMREAWPPSAAVLCLVWSYLASCRAEPGRTFGGAA